MKEIELIERYLYFCECYNKELRWYNQRFSPNPSPNNQKLTDEEILTIYFYCRRYENKHMISDIHDFVRRYMLSWFPNLPNYANFNTRLNNLSSVMSAIVPMLL